MKVSWIIPCRNEERRIGLTLREVETYLSGKHFEYEILVVDNNSTDRTAEIVRNAMKEIPEIRLIEGREPGKGGAVRVGMMAAKGDIRLFSDADNSTSPGHFDTMEPLFAQGCDIVISSRDPKDAPGAGRDVKEPLVREVLGKLGNIVIQIFGVWGIWDTQNGFKAFSQEAAGFIFPRLTVTGWAFDIEVLALARKKGFRIGIIPVHWRYETESKVTTAAYIQVFLDVFRIRWNIIRGAYTR